MSHYSAKSGAFRWTPPPSQRSFSGGQLLCPYQQPRGHETSPPRGSMPSQGLQCLCRISFMLKQRLRCAVAHVRNFIYGQKSSEPFRRGLLNVVARGTVRLDQTWEACLVSLWGRLEFTPDWPVGCELQVHVRQLRPNTNRARSDVGHRLGFAVG